MQIQGHDIGVCSWSLKPRDMRDLATKVKGLGLEHVQLDLSPLMAADEVTRNEEIRVVRDSGLKVTAGMIGFPGEDYTTIATIKKTGGFVSDSEYEKRRDITIAAAKFAAELGLPSFSLHAGFIPTSGAADYDKAVKRLGEVADQVAPLNVRLLMETGQETANELLQFINDLTRKNIHVNFDPANMILYGAGDPIDAVRILGRHIRHVHIKDAIMSDQPQIKWGTEVPFGTGQVRPRKFIDALHAVGYAGPLVIEREIGEGRSRDIQTAIEAIRQAV